MIEEMLANFENPAFVGAWAAVVVAIITVLKFVVPRKKSKRLKSITPQKTTKREMIDIIKDDVLILISSVQGRTIWQKTVFISQKYQGNGKGPKVGTLAELLAVKDSKYKEDEWQWLIPVALEELKRDGYRENLGL